MNWESYYSQLDHQVYHEWKQHYSMEEIKKGLNKPYSERIAWLWNAYTDAEKQIQGEKGVLGAVASFRKGQVPREWNEESTLWLASCLLRFHLILYSDMKEAWEQTLTVWNWLGFSEKEVHDAAALWHFTHPKTGRIQYGKMKAYHYTHQTTGNPFERALREYLKSRLDSKKTEVQAYLGFIAPSNPFQELKAAMEQFYRVRTVQ